MEILKEISDRRSIRKYKKDEVRREQLLEILEAGRLAPSGNNSQPWRFIIVNDEAKKAAIIEADGNQSWMKSAPVLIVVLADITCRQKENFDTLMKPLKCDQEKILRI